MSLRLSPPDKSEESLTALAASGSSGFAKLAQAERTRRMTERLLAEQKAKQTGEGA